MSEYTLTEALADAREWTRDADTGQRGWRPALAVILREFRVQAEELAAIRERLTATNAELGALIDSVASARERAERAEEQLAEVTAQRDIAEANLARLQDRWDARPATEELEARLAEATDWIATAHQTDCSIFWRNHTDCNCGRDALYRRLHGSAAR